MWYAAGASMSPEASIASGVPQKIVRSASLAWVYLPPSSTMASPSLRLSITRLSSAARVSSASWWAFSPEMSRRTIIARGVPPSSGGRGTPEMVTHLIGPSSLGARHSSAGTATPSSARVSGEIASVSLTPSRPRSSRSSSGISESSRTWSSSVFSSCVPKAVRSAVLACRMRPPFSTMATPSSRLAITRSSSWARRALAASERARLATLSRTCRRLRLITMPSTISTTTNTWATAARFTGSGMAAMGPVSVMVSHTPTEPVTRHAAAVTTGVNRIAVHTIVRVRMKVVGACGFRPKPTRKMAIVAAAMPSRWARSAVVGRVRAGRPASCASASQPPTRRPRIPMVPIAARLLVVRPTASDSVSEGISSSPRKVRRNEYTRTPRAIATSTQANSGSARMPARPPAPHSCGTQRRIR